VGRKVRVLRISCITKFTKKYIREFYDNERYASTCQYWVTDHEIEYDDEYDGSAPPEAGNHILYGFLQGIYHSITLFRSMNLSFSLDQSGLNDI